MRVYCGRLSPINSVIECLLLDQSPNRLQLAEVRHVGSQTKHTPSRLKATFDFADGRALTQDKHANRQFLTP